MANVANAENTSAGDFDVAVVGAGHNGLIAASILAATGKRCLVLERRETIGGLAGPLSSSNENLSGCSSCCEVVGTIIPPVVRALNLKEHGLEYLPLDPLALVLSDSDPPFALARDTARATASIRERSPKDASRYESFSEELEQFARVLSPILAKPAPQPSVENGAELFELLRLGLSVRQLGARRMREALRAFALSAADYLNDWFELDALKAAIAGSAIQGIGHGPRSVGTAAKLLFQHTAPVSGPLGFRHGIRGGVARMGQILGDAAKAHGVEIRTSSEVQRIEPDSDDGFAIILADGATVRAQTVVSNLAPRRTLLELTDPSQYTPEFLNEVQNIRHRGVTAVVNLVLDGPPQFDGVTDSSLLGGVIQIGASLDELERAYDATKYGELSETPFLIMTVPSLTDPSRKIGSHHVMNIQAQFAPYAPREGDWEQMRAPFLETILERLDPHIPKLRAQIVEQHLTTPEDYAADFGLPEGQWDQGEMTLDQLLFMRPVPGWARYRTPLEGLYLCGSGTHPGGGLIGACGHNAAKQILRDEEQSLA